VKLPVLLLASAIAFASSFRCEAAPGPPVPSVSETGLVFLSGKLAALRGGLDGKVRILHLGDSHVASDSLTFAAREALQSAYGNGGPGAMMPWAAPKAFRRAGVSAGSTAGWRRHVPNRAGGIEDAGLSGCYVESSSAGEEAWLRADAVLFRVALLRQPGGGTVDFSIDGRFAGRRFLGADAAEAETVVLRADGPGAAHRLSIRVAGDGRVRLLGVSAENGVPGVVYGALGVAGARAEDLLKIRPEVFRRLLAAEAPDLVVVAFGTNEASSSGFDPAACEASLSRVIATIRETLPFSAVAIQTPPDRADPQAATALRSRAALSQVVALQRATAAREGLPVIDLYDMMGGAGTAAGWRASSPPLAQPDGTHFTKAGYARLGRMLGDGLLALHARTQETPAYAAYLRENGAPPAPRAVRGSAAVPAVEKTPEAGGKLHYFLKPDGTLFITDDLARGAEGNGRRLTESEFREQVNSSPPEGAEEAR
jgi:lysophospholipase L1-like esterase